MNIFIWPIKCKKNFSKREQQNGTGFLVTFVVRLIVLLSQQFDISIDKVLQSSKSSNELKQHFPLFNIKNNFDGFVILEALNTGKSQRRLLLSEKWRIPEYVNNMVNFISKSPNLPLLLSSHFKTYSWWMREIAWIPTNRIDLNRFVLNYNFFENKIKLQKKVFSI